MFSDEAVSEFVTFATPTDSSTMLTLRKGKEKLLFLVVEVLHEGEELMLFLVVGVGIAVTVTLTLSAMLVVLR